MPIIAPDVVRFSIVGSLFGEDCINILDVNLNAAIGETRTEFLDDLAGDILNQWADHILPVLSAGYEFQEVRFVDLDSATGRTGSVTSTDGTTLPQPGGTTGQALPNSVYAKVSKVLEAKTRVQRNGTLRLSGLPESYTTGANGNILEPTQQAGINAAFEELKDGINGNNGDYTANLVVVHTVDQAYTGQSEIANFVVRSQVGTIRRRMPGYGT